MSHAPSRSKLTHPAEAVRIDTTPIELPDGWRGRVVTPSPQNPRETALPHPAAWRTILQAFLDHPMSMDDTVTLKYSAGSEVLRGTLSWELGRVDVVVKHHTPSGMSGRLSAMLSGSRAQRNFDRAAALLEAAVSTARPLVWIERRKPKLESWLITAYVSDLVDLDHVALALLPQAASDELRHIKNSVIAAVSRMFEGLARGGWHHRDLKASNILLQHWTTPGLELQAWLVDLDGLSRSRPAQHRHERQRLVRLAASLICYESITRTDYIRFLKTYRNAFGSGRDWRDEFRLLALEAGRYATRSVRRKSHKLDGYAGD